LLERQTGRVPTIDQLASKLGIDAGIIRNVIQKFLGNQKAEGTSAFRASLLEIMMDEQMHGHHVLVIDEQMHGNHVLAIDEDGDQLGILSTKDALHLARDKGLDLVLIQPDGNPPVARIMDYGRFKFEHRRRNET